MSTPHVLRFAALAAALALTAVAWLGLPAVAAAADPAADLKQELRGVPYQIVYETCAATTGNSSRSTPTAPTR